MKNIFTTKINWGKLVLVFLMLIGAFNVRANSNSHGNTGMDFVCEFRYSNFSSIFQDSVTRWNPVSTANMSFGKMTMYENRNSSKITWKSGQSSAFETITDDESGTVIHLLSAPKFGGDRCRYLVLVFDEDVMTVEFYTTEKDLDENSFFMQGSYEQAK